MESKAVSIRIPVDVLESIRDEGETEMRSISNMALVLISEALAARWAARK